MCVYKSTWIWLRHETYLHSSDSLVSYSSKSEKFSSPVNMSVQKTVQFLSCEAETTWSAVRLQNTSCCSWKGERAVRRFQHPVNTLHLTVNLHQTVWKPLICEEIHSAVNDWMQCFLCIQEERMENSSSEHLSLLCLNVKCRKQTWQRLHVLERTVTPFGPKRFRCWLWTRVVPTLCWSRTENRSCTGLGAELSWPRSN